MIVLIAGIVLLALGMALLLVGKVFMGVVCLLMALFSTKEALTR